MVTHGVVQAASVASGPWGSLSGQSEAAPAVEPEEVRRPRSESSRLRQVGVPPCNNASVWLTQGSPTLADEVIAVPRGAGDVDHLADAQHSPRSITAWPACPGTVRNCSLGPAGMAKSSHA